MLVIGRAAELETSMQTEGKVEPACAFIACTLFSSPCSDHVRRSWHRQVGLWRASIANEDGSHSEGTTVHVIPVPAARPAAWCEIARQSLSRRGKPQEDI